MDRPDRDFSGFITFLDYGEDLPALQHPAEGLSLHHANAAITNTCPYPVASSGSGCEHLRLEATALADCSKSPHRVEA